MAYGCLFCRTGKEEAVAKEVQAAHAQVRAVAASKEKHKTRHGEKTKIREVFLPGYVFFETPQDMSALDWLPKTDVIRLLQYGDGLWKLSGEDREFARWLFRYGGLLRFSEAYKVGDRVRITSGPLKDMEGWITKLDRRGKSAQVVLHFLNAPVPVWLGFDLINARPVSPHGTVQGIQE